MGVHETAECEHDKPTDCDQAGIDVLHQQRHFGYNAEQIGLVLAWTRLPQLVIIPLVLREAIRQPVDRLTGQSEEREHSARVAR
jgi:hypothetical protein